MMGMNQGRIAELEREILGLRGQWERDQMMLERYDAVSFLSILLVQGRNETDPLRHKSSE